MKIARISAENFKSFPSIDLKLNDFNVLVGPNASGKSSFFELLRFLRDIEEHGLSSALLMQGEWECLLSFSANPSDSLSIAVEFSSRGEFAFPLPGPDAVIYEVAFPRVLYKLEIGVSEDTRLPTIKHESLMLNVLTTGKPRKAKQQSVIPGLEDADWSTILISRRGNTLETKLKKSPAFKLDEGQLLPPFIRNESLDSDQSILSARFVYFLLRRSLFSGIACFDFDPKMIKSSAKARGKVTLDYDGANLPLVLRRISRDPESSKRFKSLLNSVLPFVQSVAASSAVDKSLLLHFEEGFTSNRKPVPASLISDGTIHVSALIAAAFFEDANTLLIEEPERGLHPSLIGRVVTMLKDQSEYKQILFTTHNPISLRNISTKDLVLVRRKTNGHSSIVRASDVAEVSAFVKNELGLDELHMDNLL